MPNIGQEIAKGQGVPETPGGVETGRKVPSGGGYPPLEGPEPGLPSNLALEGVEKSKIGQFFDFSPAPPRETANPSGD